MHQKSTIRLIQERLQEAFDLGHLEVFDESEQHRGHGGYVEGSTTHVRIVIAAAEFDGQSRVAQQRAVYAALGNLIGAPLHAIGIEVVDTTAATGNSQSV